MAEQETGPRLPNRPPPWGDNLAMSLPREEIVPADEPEPTQCFAWQMARSDRVPEHIKRASIEYIELCKATGCDSAVVVHEGKIVDIYYSESCPSRYYVMSSTKSVVAVAAYMIREQLGLDFAQMKVCDVMKDVLGWESWQQDSKKREVTVAHILNHTACMPGNKWFKKHLGNDNSRDQFNGKDNRNEGARIHSLRDVEPGADFDYSNPTAQLLDEILSEILRSQGQNISLQEYVHSRLFEELGMARSSLSTDQYGVCDVFGGMKSIVLDMARLALMVLNEGQLHSSSKRLLSAESIKAMLPQETPPDSGYANQWWINKAPLPQGFNALGYLDNNTHVVKEHKLIFGRTQSQLPVSDTYLTHVQGILTSLLGSALS